MQIEQILIGNGMVATVHQHIRPSHVRVHVIRSTIVAHAHICVTVVNSTTVHVRLQVKISLFSLSLLENMGVSGRLCGVYLCMVVLLLTGEAVQVTVRVGRSDGGRSLCMVKFNLLML